MQAPLIGSHEQPFPLERPPIKIQPVDGLSFAFNADRMPGWDVALHAGATAWMAWYDPPQWRLTSVTFQQTVRPAEVHQIEGWEVRNLEWEAEQGSWKEGITHYARLTQDHFEWLATSRIRGDKRVLYTFLDEGFDDDWGRWPRIAQDIGQHSAGQALQVTLPSGPGCPHYVNVSTGMFEVTIGGRSTSCLRVVHLLLKNRGADAHHLERSILAENYFAADGQLFLFRRFNGRLWQVSEDSTRQEKTWERRYPQNDKLVVNGATFVHWYDCLRDTSLPQT